MFIINKFIIYIILISFISILVYAKPSIVPSNESYWKERDILIQADVNRMLGHDVILSAEEEQVNTVLMSLKDKEMDEAFKNVDFLPSKNFLEVRDRIDQSEVFKFIKKMPKGAVLHIHELAMTSSEWVISNITYWDDLYMCNSTSTDAIMFRFFESPDETCNWTLVSEERSKYSSPEEFDEYLLSKICLHSDDAEKYRDINRIWKAFEDDFAALSGLVLYYKAWEAYLYRALEECIEDNVSYIEFRGVLTSLYDKDGREFNEMETYEVYDNVIQNFTSLHSDTFIGARYIYAPYRRVDVDMVWYYVDVMIKLKENFPDTIAGFDLVGQEDLGRPLSSFIDPLLYLKSHNPPIPVFFHSGETNWHGMLTDTNLFDTLLLNATRIGHGYAIIKHPELMKIAKERDIPVEVSPISNQVLMLVGDLRNHPAGALAADSFPLVVSSDDPSMWESTLLSHDFYEFFMGIGGGKADLKLLKKLALNSIKYSSLDEKLKLNYQKLWEAKWNDFIQNIYKNITTTVEFFP